MALIGSNSLILSRLVIWVPNSLGPIGRLEGQELTLNCIRSSAMKIGMMCLTLVLLLIMMISTLITATCW